MSFAVAALLALAASVDCGALQWRHLPPTNGSRLDIVFESYGLNGDRYAAYGPDRDHLTCNGYFTLYRSPVPYPPQADIKFSSGQQARLGVAEFANNTVGVPVAGVFDIYKLQTISSPHPDPKRPFLAHARVEFVVSPRHGSNVTVANDSDAPHLCAFAFADDGLTVGIVCGAPTAVVQPPARARPFGP